MKRKRLEVCAALVLALSSWLSVNTVQAWAVGGHLGLNLDHGDIHLGADMLFPLVELSPNVRLSIWPSVAYVFVQDGHDALLLGGDLPFEFLVRDSIVSPFVGPGLGLAIDREPHLKLNIIGGLFINPSDRVRLFGELALRFVQGTYVDLLFGVLFEL